MIKISRSSSILMSLLIISFVIAYISPVTYTNSDPEGSLLTSQAIIQQKTVKLDSYIDRNESQRHQLFLHNDHIYYFYPLGTSIISIPFVGVSLLFGKDMSIYQDQAALQNFISAICVALTCLLIFRLSNLYLDRFQSLIPVVIFTFGSSLMSTNGTALWSTVYLVIIYLVILIILFQEQAKHTRGKYILIGLLLFVTFICRPTAVVFILVTLIYIFVTNRANFFYAAITSFLLLCGFIVFSFFEYQLFLPPYYSLVNQMKPDIVTGLTGLLISPSRGLFIYSPFLLFIFIGLFNFTKLNPMSPFIWFGYVWFFLHTILVSSWGNWWGGHSYGSRLMTDIIPALILIYIFVIKLYSDFPTIYIRKIIFATFLILVSTSIITNSYVGLFKTDILLWNVVVNADSTPKLINSWKYPQFLANQKMFMDIQFDMQKEAFDKNIELVQSYRIGMDIFPNDNVGVYLGWYEPENYGEYRWSSQKESLIFLKFDEETLKGHQVVDLCIKPGIAYTKTVYLEVNGYEVAHFTGENGVESPVYKIPIDTSILKTDLVEIKFITPDERPINKFDENSDDNRNIGIRLFQLKFIDHQE